MRAALFLACLCACSSSGTYVLLTVEAGAGVPDGIVSLELGLELGGKNAAAHFDQHGAALSLPTTLVLDVGSGAGALAIAADGNDASGNTLAQGSVTATVIRGQTVTARVTLEPMAGNQLAIDRMQYDFGTITTNTTAGPIAFTVTNNGSETSGVLTHSVSGDSSAFDINGCDGQALAPGATCVVQVSFKPTAAGNFQISFTVAGSPGGSVSATVSGMAVAPSPLKIAPAPESYGDVLIGVTVSQLFTVTNSGSVGSGVLTVALTGSDAGQFVISADGCGGNPLAPQASCTFTVTFTPSGTTGDRAASLTVTGSPGGTAVSALSGRALTPASLSASEMTHDFGTVDVGQSAGTVVFTITNNGGQSTGTLATALTGSTTDFVVDMNACTGQSLPYLGTCMLSGHFAPQSYGPKSATVTVSGTPGAAAVMTWTGVGHDQVTLTVNQPFGGNGSGSVSGLNIDCPATACSAVIDRNASAPPSATLMASPAVGSLFVSWSGDCSGNNPQCTLAMDGSKSAQPAFARQRFTLTVTQNNFGGASGLVTSTTTPAESGEIDCGATCSVDRDYGDTVTLSPSPSPSPSPGFYFGGWGGDCSGTGACTLTMTASHSVVASFTPANKIFTTATVYAMGDVQSHGTGPDAGSKMVSGADAICAAAGGAGTWKAYISRTGVNAKDRIPPTARGWVRPDGLPFGDSLSSILIGQVYYPLVLDENGAPVSATDSSWTGTNLDGTVALGSGQPCADWTDTSAFAFTENGLVGGASAAWSTYLISGCAGTKHLICLQTDYFAAVAPTPPPANHRYLFLTSSSLSGAAGLGAADTLCQTWATGRLPGTYLAFLGTNGATPASRFTARGDAVVRPDGAIVAATDTSFLAGGAINTPPCVGSNAGYANSSSLQVWTGAPAANVAGDTTNTCYDSGSLTSWVASGSRGLWGEGSALTAWMNGGGGTNGCVVNSPIYCLQE